MARHSRQGPTEEAYADCEITTRARASARPVSGCARNHSGRRYARVHKCARRRSACHRRHHGGHWLLPNGLGSTTVPRINLSGSTSGKSSRMSCPAPLAYAHRENGGLRSRAIVLLSSEHAARGRSRSRCGFSCRRLPQTGRRSIRRITERHCSEIIARQSLRALHGPHDTR